MLKKVSNQFIRFAERECRSVSPLYDSLSMKIAEDRELLELASHAPHNQPTPNLFFGAVQYLLLKGKNHPLKEFYRSIVEVALHDEHAFPVFKDFCLQYEQEMITILKTKLVQTNEVRRCGYLYPTFCSIYELVKKPLALIEIGTSAGLQLFWDQYCYSYGTGTVYGNKDSSVHISSNVKGDRFPKRMELSPPVMLRIGVDLHVNDVRNEDDERWLKALIWPEHVERRKLYESAAAFVQRQEIQFIEGNGVELLPNFVQDIPDEAVICLFHTHVANQMPSEMKEQLLDEVERIGKYRNVFHLYNNIIDQDLYLDYFLEGKKHHQKVARTDGHGRWFEWTLNE